LREERLSMGIKLAPGFGKYHPAAGAFEQLVLELAFERPNLLAKSRLRNPKLMLGLSETSELGDVNEVRELLEVRGASGGSRRYASREYQV
jgi:hypothetical protein